jgi:Tfp pilus assembly protein PilF
MTKSTPVAALLLVCWVHAVEAEEIWREWRSSNFVMVSNATEATATSALARLEQFRFTLARVLPNRRLGEELTTQVYGFRDFDSLEPFLPQSEERRSSVAGYFQSGLFKNVIALDLSAPPHAFENVVFHEYVHLVLSFDRRRYPLWFEEGLAEFYSGVGLRADRAELGLTSPVHRQILAEEPLIPLSSLLVADESSAVYLEPEASRVFYAESWALLHYLLVGRDTDGQTRLARFLARLSSGEEVIEAFASAFERTPDEMEAELRLYLSRVELPTIDVELAGLERELSFEGRRLSRAEVQNRWAELFLEIDQPTEARVCLDEARRLDPDLATTYETMGLAYFQTGAFDDAEASLKAAMDRGGASALGLYYYARLLLRDYSGLWVDEIPDRVAVEAIDALRRSLELKPGQIQATRLLAFVYSVRGEKLSEADGLLGSALEIAPNDASLLYTYGQVLAKQGEYERARAALDRAVIESDDPALAEAAEEFLSRMESLVRAPQR